MRYAGGSALKATLRTPAGDIPVLVDVVEVVDIRHGFPDRGGRLWSTAFPREVPRDIALQLVLPNGATEMIRILGTEQHTHIGDEAEIFTEASFVDDRQYRRGMSTHMRATEQLAKIIAISAVAQPYRQIDVMTTRQFVAWLKARDIDFDWQTIHRFWQAGVVLPILVLDPARSSPGLPDDGARFSPIDLGFERSTFVDLGLDVTEQGATGPRGTLPEALADSLLWHPFQLWTFHHLYGRLDLSVGRTSGADAYADLVSRIASGVPEGIASLSNSDLRGSHHFLRLLALLLMAEPLVHTSIDMKVRLRPYAGETVDGYFSWVAGQAGAEMLAQADLSLEEAKTWHADIATYSMLYDPLQDLRVLMRQIDHTKRDAMRGAPLLFHSFYDVAETIRRYLEQYQGVVLPEEDDFQSGSGYRQMKQAMYGASRTADYDREVLRRIARDFDIDPQPRVAWFVEGQTEEACIRRIAALRKLNLGRIGIDLLNLKGLGGLAGDRLRSSLKTFQTEEIFPYISIDKDRVASSLRDLRWYASQRLLPIGYKVWEPDFEAANFSIEELAQIATKMAADDGFSTPISPEDLRAEMGASDAPVGRAIEKVWSRMKFYGNKGETWGQYLADWVVSNPSPDSLAMEDKKRPIDALFTWLLRIQMVDYRLTIAEYQVDGQGACRKKEARDR